MIEAQGGDVGAMERFAPSPSVAELRATRDGYIEEIDAVTLGNAAREWSAKDHMAGVRVNVRLGDVVKRGDVLAYLYGAHAKTERIEDAFTIGSARPALHPFVYATI
jgi:thymidine phosphorylase